MSVRTGDERIGNHPRALNAALSRTAGAAVALAGVALVGMASVEAWQVFARYVLNDSPSWTEPVALLCMSTAMMLGTAAAVRTRRHFGFFILAERAPPALRRALGLFTNLIAAGIGCMLAFWGVQMLFDAWDFPMAGAPLPQGVFFLPLSIGGILIALFAIEQIVAPPAEAPRSE
jgi:TRAP-type C4-dicarboxylate transport system permease small subunit